MSAGAISAAQAQPAPPTASTLGAAAPAAAQAITIDRNGVLILIRSTLIAVDQANRTGNYTVLRDLGAPGFQAANNAARLSEIFATLRGQNLDLSGVAVLEPQLTILPTSAPGGMMRMAGFFPSVPTQVNFEMLFAPVESRWRLFGIAVSLGQPGPVAPPDPTADKPAEAAPASAAKEPEAKPPAVADQKPARPPARPAQRAPRSTAPAPAPE